MKLNVAIIGFGGMGRWHHENITNRVEELNVKGIYDIQQSACDVAVERGVQVYDSVDAICNDKEIDIVVVATPNDSHKPLIIKCLRAGKNVISEKPVTLHYTDLEEVIQVAKETGKLFSVHQNRRWDNDFLIVKKLLDSGEVGEPYFIESRVQGSRGPMHGWRGHKLNGGGMLLDWGVHLIDQLLMLIDSPVVSVDAHLFNLYSEEVDDNIKIYLRFENRVSAVFEMATNCFINHPRWHLECKEGTVIIEDFKCNGRVVKLQTDAVMEWADDIIYTEAGPTRTMAPRPSETTKITDLPVVKSNWSEFYKNIADVINNGAELIVKPEQVMRTMKVIDAIFESEEKGYGVSCRI